MVAKIKSGMVLPIASRAKAVQEAFREASTEVWYRCSGRRVRFNARKRGRRLSACQLLQAGQEPMESSNALLRELHLARHETQSDLPMPPPPFNEASAQPFAVRSHRRTPAQRAAAAKLSEPRPANEERRRAEPAPLIGCEAFYKHQQEGIRNYRMAYNKRVDSHFESLGPNRAQAAASALPAPADSIGALAHEMAGRHVEPIREYIASSKSDV